MVRVLASIVFLVASAVGDIPDTPRLDVSSSTLDSHRVKVAAFNQPTDNVLWNKVVCKGQMLSLAMTLDLPEAGRICQPITSPWDGTLERELALWGYMDASYEDEEDDSCDMGEDGHGLQDMLEEIGADSGDHMDGRDNICHIIRHQYGPTVEEDENGDIPDPSGQYYTVNGRKYRSTGAEFTIGINRKAGIIFFLNRENPATAAKDLWEVQEVNQDQLPALRLSSDIAWGIWNRYLGGIRISNINYFFSVAIVNEDTRRVIERAMRNVGQNYLPKAPEYTFPAGTDEFCAPLGSPNAIGAAYFLAQHKTQFGHNRYISEISIFEPNGPMNVVSMLMKVE